MRKKTLQEVQDEVIKLGHIPLFTEYKDAHTLLKIQCKKHGIFYTTEHRIRLAIQRNSNCCRKCANEKLRYTTENVKDIIQKSGLIPLFDKYLNLKQKILVECPIHGKFETTFGNIQRNIKRGFNGCKKCSYKKISESHNLSETQRIRERCIPHLHQWKNKIFQKYNYTCQKCFKYGCKINAHHIYNFADYPELRVDLDNGIVLCEDCHKKFHKLFGKKKNTAEQLIKFLKME